MKSLLSMVNVSLDVPFFLAYAFAKHESKDRCCRDCEEIAVLSFKLSDFK